MEDARGAYSRLVGHFRRAAIFQSCLELIGWDERTYMPPSGGELRAEQSSLLARLHHDLVSETWIREALQLVGENISQFHPDYKVEPNIREWKRLVKRASLVPPSLVEEIASTCVYSQQAWVNARAKNDFPSYLPWLEKVIRLKREEAKCYSTTPALYDSLIEEYEPGCTSSYLEHVFSVLKPVLVKFAREFATPNGSSEKFKGCFTSEKQKEFSSWVAAQCGFDFSAGRLDTTAHPFCCGIGPGDCRITTRFNENDFTMGFFGVLHETGHGLYEQGLSKADFGLPSGAACSLGIHESQSRLWENQVGRSMWFWKWCFPSAVNYFPEALSSHSLANFLKTINSVCPGFIRVDADEVTYNLHIMLRFDLEKDLIQDNLQPRDLPFAWQGKMEEYLGLTPPTDSLGCLQDIHWSAGLMGYFPTYLLGNLYSAQIFQKAAKELDLEKRKCSHGALLEIREWLRTKIHSLGKCFSAKDLCKIATGDELTTNSFIHYLRTKYAGMES